MVDLVKGLVDCISQGDELQGKYRHCWEATDSEKEELNNMLQYFVSEGYDMKFIIVAH